jgi:putative tryptophan/tyrosine transport system substrate-binding protein
MRLSTIGLIAIVAFALLVAPLAAEAQQQGKVPRIGILTPAFEASTPLWEAFRQGLRDLGYEEGKNIILEYRFAAGQNERLPELAAELVRLKVEIIVADGGVATAAAQHATGTIPIVFPAVPDPVAQGLVASLAQPGRNATGLSVMSPELSGKRLGLLKEAFPTVSRLAVLRCEPMQAVSITWPETEAAARILSVQLQPLQACTPDELVSAFVAMTREGAEALIALPSAVLWNDRTRVVELAIQNRLPAMFPEREFADAGGLMAYGPSVAANFRRATTYVDKILKGAQPADLPVEQPMTFPLVLNLKTAKTLGLTIPPSLLFQADEVIR